MKCKYNIYDLILCYISKQSRIKWFHIRISNHVSLVTLSFHIYIGIQDQARKIGLHTKFDLTESINLSYLGSKSKRKTQFTLGLTTCVKIKVCLSFYVYVPTRIINLNRPFFRKVS